MTGFGGGDERESAREVRGGRCLAGAGALSDRLLLGLDKRGESLGSRTDRRCRTRGGRRSSHRVRVGDVLGPERLEVGCEPWMRRDDRVVERDELGLAVRDGEADLRVGIRGG